MCNLMILQDFRQRWQAGSAAGGMGENSCANIIYYKCVLVTRF